MMLKKNGLFILTTVFICSIFSINLNCFAQAAKIEIDKNSILIGEPIKFNLFIQHSVGEKVLITIPDSIPHFQILDQRSLDTSFKDGLQILRTQIIFTSFDSGTFYIPELQYEVNGINGNTDSSKIEVGYMAIDSTAIPRDVKNIIEVNTFNWWYIIGLVMAFIAVLLIYIIYKKINNKKLHFDGSKKIDPYKNALVALQKLADENVKQNLEVKTFHSKLAHIFKIYCSNVLQQNLLVDTTTEVLKKLENYDIKYENLTTAKQALQTTDAAKFAKYEPSISESESAMQYIKNSIDAIHVKQNKK